MINLSPPNSPCSVEEFKYDQIEKISWKEEFDYFFWELVRPGRVLVELNTFFEFCFSFYFTRNYFNSFSEFSTAVNPKK